MSFLFYNCEFCICDKFINLYYEIGDKYNYYELLDGKIKNQKENEKITTNKFKLWIINNYDNILK